jgi:phospholipase D-like protein
MAVSKQFRSRQFRSRQFRSRQWRDLSQRQRKGLLALSALEFALTVTAAVDLFRRPRQQIRGPKALWWPAILVQPVGPVAYLALGRRAGIRR